MQRALSILGPIVLFAAVFLAPGGAAAQPRTGDWMLGDTGQTHNGILSFDPRKSAPAPLSTLTLGGIGIYYNWIRMHPDNRSLLVGLSGKGEIGLVQVPSGTYTSIMAVPDAPNGFEMQQDGSFVLSSSGGDQLLRVDLVNGVTSLLTTLPSILNHVTVDRDSGELVAATFDMNSMAGGRLLRVSRAGVVLGTLAAGFGMTTGVDWDPLTGGFFVTSYDAPEVTFVNRKGVVTTVAKFRGANAVRVDKESGDLIVCGFDRSARLNRQGSVVAKQDHTHTLKNGVFNWTAVEIYGSQKLIGAGETRAGGSYALQVRFPDSPHRPYAVLASLTGFRPGIRLGDGSGRVISLAPDSLFYTLIQNGNIPGVLTDFRGTLDASGAPLKSVNVKIPVGTPKGFRVCFAAVAFNPSMGWGLDVSNPWSLIVQ